MKVSDRAIRKPVSPAQVLHVGADGARRAPDRLVTEEPMEIRAHGPGVTELRADGEQRCGQHDRASSSGSHATRRRYCERSGGVEPE